MKYPYLVRIKHGGKAGPDWGVFRRSGTWWFDAEGRVIMGGAKFYGLPATHPSSPTTPTTCIAST